MGLFKRKPAEEEPKVEAPVLRDGDGWRVCVHYGAMMFDKGEIPYAVDFWTEAVDMRPSFSLMPYWVTIFRARAVAR